MTEELPNYYCIVFVSYNHCSFRYRARPWGRLIMGFSVQQIVLKPENGVSIRLARHVIALIG